MTPSYRPTAFNRPPPYVRSMRGARFACLFVCHREGEKEIDYERDGLLKAEPWGLRTLLRAGIRHAQSVPPLNISFTGLST